MTCVQTSSARSPALHDDCAFGWRIAAITRSSGAGDGDQENEDAWIIRHTGSGLVVGIVDVATQKRGISGAAIQDAVVDALTSASGLASPAELVGAAHVQLRQLLDERGALGVACLLIVRLTADGAVSWAHAGDAVLIRWRPSSWLRPASTQALNTRHRRGHGLTQCIGTRSEAGPRIEEGYFVAGVGERLLLATDGVFHDDMSMAPIGRWIDAHHRLGHTLLTSDLARKIEGETRSYQPDPDDTGLVVAERLPGLWGAGRIGR